MGNFHEHGRGACNVIRPNQNEGMNVGKKIIV